MRVALLLMLWAGPVIAAEITAAEFVQQATKAAAESNDMAASAKSRLANLMTRYSDMELGVALYGPEAKTETRVLPIYVVPAETLRALTPTSRALDALKATNRAYWPVYFPSGADPEKQVVTLSSVEVMKTGTGWKTARMGGAGYAESVWTAMDEAQWPEEAILVQMPSLGLHFIGFVRKEQLYLSLIAGAPGVNVKERTPEPADAVLPRLVPLAADQEVVPCSPPPSPPPPQS